MADIVDPSTRSRMMSGIRGRDTKIELTIRKALFAKGYRYRINRRDLLGRPDIVLPKFRSVIFARGCSWHLHGCFLSKIPATRPEFWRDKLEGNRRHDKVPLARLEELGWRIATVWECSLRNKGEAGILAVTVGLDRWLKGMGEVAELAG